MSNYFRFLPKIDYQLKVANTTVSPTLLEITNITSRAIFRDTISRVIGNEGIAYYPYSIQDGDRPDSIAEYYYGDSKYAWVVLYSNDIIDPLHDWSKTQAEFEGYIIHKYGSVAAAQSQIAEYEGVITDKTVRFDGEVIDERVVKLDSTAYTSYTGTKRTVTAYEKEERENDDKRQIRLLRKSLLQRAQKELSRAFVETSVLEANTLYTTSINRLRASGQ